MKKKVMFCGNMYSQRETLRDVAMVCSSDLFVSPMAFVMLILEKLTACDAFDCYLEAVNGKYRLEIWERSEFFKAEAMFSNLNYRKELGLFCIEVLHFIDEHTEEDGLTRFYGIDND